MYFCTKKSVLLFNFRFFYASMTRDIIPESEKE